jgi:hypothetical protein
MTEWIVKVAVHVDQDLEFTTGRGNRSMNTGRRLGLTALLVNLVAGPAFAQSPYVGAALVGDVFRTTHSESTGGQDFSAGGETIGFALRVGTPLGSRWGVELEFTRPGEIETDFTGGSIPLANWIEIVTSSTMTPIGSTAAQVFPVPPFYRFRATQRNTTLSTTAWVNQELSPRVSLVFLAGMGFHRTTNESESRFDLLPVDIARPGLIPWRTKTVTYGVRPLAGLEARIGLTDHIDLVPGIRLHGLDNGWLLRPAVGLDWKF